MTDNVIWTNRFKQASQRQANLKLVEQFKRSIDLCDRKPDLMNGPHTDGDVA